MIMSRILRAVGAVAVLFAVGGCTDLVVDNPNEPDRDRALSKPADVEALIAGQFRTFWLIQQGRAPGPALDGMAEVESNSSANWGFDDVSKMPPEPIINQVAYTWGYWMQDPFLLQNRGLAALRDGLQAIEARRLQIPQGPRLQAYAKLMQGLFHGNIALMYDRGYIVDETTQDAALLELHSYADVMAASRRYLAEARAIASQNNFTIPDGWMGPGAKTRQTFVQLTHSYEARFMAQMARTPAERAQVDWNQVLEHTRQGITQDFGVELDGPGGVWNSSIKQRTSLQTDAHLALIGPSDQSGAYRSWENTPPAQRLPFLIDTDDRRITDGTPRGPGKYAVWRNFTTNQPERGAWHLSNYSRYGWYTRIGDTSFGFAPDITVKEMNLLAAEAHIRLGNPAAALPLINATRVTIGELPPATLQGATGPRCVPRAVGPLAKASNVPEGGCGDLLQALIYEKRLENAFLSQGSIYYDARGFGTLRTGRAIHVPIPMEDLQLLGVPHYTFGGVGGPGAAQ
jgi:hypothetical protein